MQALLNRIKDEGMRARLARDMEQGGDWAGWKRPEWDEWLVCRVGRPEHRGWLGQTIAELSTERGLLPVETALLMFLEDGGQYCVAPQDKCDADMDQLVSHTLGGITADGFALAREGALAYQDRPNSYGSFVRVLGRYVRERGVLRWEDAVRKMTSVPAQRLRLWDRGVIRPDMAADLVVFDPQRVIERADYARPQEYPDGVDWVIVNGQVTVTPQGHTGSQAGKVIVA